MNSNSNITLPLNTVARPAFQAAFLKLCAEPLTPGEKYRLARAKRVLGEALEHYTAVHAELVRQYSADGTGSEVDTCQPEKLKAFLSAMNALGVETVTLELPLLQLPPQSQLNAADMAEVLEFLEEPK